MDTCTTAYSRIPRKQRRATDENLAGRLIRLALSQNFVPATAAIVGPPDTHPKWVGFGAYPPTTRIREPDIDEVLTRKHVDTGPAFATVVCAQETGTVESGEPTYTAAHRDPATFLVDEIRIAEETCAPGGGPPAIQRSRMNGREGPARVWLLAQSRMSS